MRQVAVAVESHISGPVSSFEPCRGDLQARIHGIKAAGNVPPEPRGLSSRTVPREGVGTMAWPLLLVLPGAETDTCYSVRLCTRTLSNGFLSAVARSDTPALSGDS